MLEVENFSYAWSESSNWTLKEVNLKIDSGQCCCVTGVSGSGKSTFALALKGMLPKGRSTGKVVYSGSGGSDPKVGLVLQNPETQLFANTVVEEVAFALENQAVEPERMPELITAALTSVGLNLPLDCPVATLSMGQKYRLLIAAVLVMRPQLLILDEPAAQLDECGLEELRSLIGKLTRQGTALLLCEHRPEVFSSCLDKLWRIEDGTLAEELLKTDMQPSFTATRWPVTRSSDSPVVVRAENLSAGWDPEQPLWSGATFSVHAGERVLVHGSNGSGKSTLLSLLSGLTTPLSGTLEVFGQKPIIRTLRGRVGYLFQNPQRQLFEERVIDEVSFTLRRTISEAAQRKQLSMDVLDRCGMQDVAEKSPHKLSYGQKHLVALASIIVAQPRLLLLDDPFAGLDHADRERVWQLLMNCPGSVAPTIIWTSHHRDEIKGQADVLLTVAGGQIGCRRVAQ